MMLPSDFNPEKKTRQRYFARESSKRGLAEGVKLLGAIATFKISLSVGKADWTRGRDLGIRSFTDYLLERFDSKDWEYKTYGQSSSLEVEVVGVRNVDEATAAVQKEIEKAQTAFEAKLAAAKLGKKS